MEVKKPIFIIGIGRSGTSIFHRIMVRHPQLAWMSGFGKKFPDKPYYNRWLMKGIDIPIISNFMQKRFKPWECHDFWEHYCKGFRRISRDLTKEDVTRRNKNKIRKVLPKLLTAKRNRLILKATGWPRIGYLSEIYNDAKFIHIIRDGRSVVNSMINVNWWQGWQGPQNWRWGELDSDLQSEWESYEKSYIALAAIQWKIFLAAIEKGKKHLSENNFLEIKYEELCNNPIEEVKKAVHFCELDWSNGYSDIVRKFNVKSANYKWKEELKISQQKMIEEIMKFQLKAYKYISN